MDPGVLALQTLSQDGKGLMPASYKSNASQMRKACPTISIALAKLMLSLGRAYKEKRPGIPCNGP